MCFGGSEEPCAFVQVISIGAIGGDKNKKVRGSCAAARTVRWNGRFKLWNAVSGDGACGVLLGTVVRSGATTFPASPRGVRRGRRGLRMLTHWACVHFQAHGEGAVVLQLRTVG